MKRNYITLFAIALISLPSWAQKQQTHLKDSTVNRTVKVEQDYAPNIQDASKINVLPQVTEPTVSKKEVEYATTWAPANRIPANEMQAYTGKEVQTLSKPGYVRLGYGNYGNLDLLANYLFHLSSKDKLNVNFQMDGMNGELTMPYRFDNEKWDAHYYRTRAKVDYLHQFSKLDLNVAGNFGLSNFNLQPGSAGKQKFTSGDVHFGVKSTDETLPLQFNAETNLMLYNRQQNAYNGLVEGVDETALRTKALVSGMINDEQQIAIALNMTNLFYTETPNFFEKLVFSNRTLLDFNPHYELATDNWHLRLGANVDCSFGSGKSLRVSPDIVAEYIFSDSYILYGKATGGRQINDLRQLEALNPYAIYTLPIIDTYEQVNAQLGFKASPAPNLWLNLFAGYQNLKDDLFPYEQSVVGGSISNWLDYDYTQSDNFYAGAEFSYAYKDLFSLSAQGTYYHWNAENKDPYNACLLMKPEFKFGFTAEVHPIAPLRLNAGYQYTQWAFNDARLNRKIPAINNLSIGVSYEVFKGISLYARLNNLLNKTYQWYYTIPTEGFNLLGGLSFQF